MPAPPKPWERNASSSLPAGHPPTTGGGTCPVAGAGSPSRTTPTTVATGTVTAPGGVTAAGTTPALPPRTTAMAANPAATGLAGTSTSALGGYGATGYGTTGYGTSGYGSRLGGYGGGYGGMSRFGGYGGGYGYGMGGYGMGGYGMGGYGMGGYGMGGYGMGPGGMGQDGFSLSQRMEAGTQATFQILESIVGAFGGFAQMLESTFMATHSSFFAMVGVAEQFGHLRNYLGQVLSIFALIRWLKGLLFRLMGRDVPPELAHPWGAPQGLNADAFRAFEATGGAAGAAAGGPNAAGPERPRLSRRPLIVFFLTVVGLPYLMNRLVRLITARQEEEARRRAEAGLPPLGPDGQPLLVGPNGMPLVGPDGLPQPAGQASDAAIDPSTLTFVRATHAFDSEEPAELSFRPNDIIAVLTPRAERTEPGWWRGRSRDGRIGWFPSTHVAELKTGPAAATAKGAKAVDEKGPKGGAGGAAGPDGAKAARAA